LLGFAAHPNALFANPEITMKNTILMLTCWTLLACNQDPTSTPETLSLSKYSREDLCCSVTLNQLDADRWEASGCGKRGVYKQHRGSWQRIGKILPGPGSAADKLPICTQ
jgi:hypothetical protein